MKEYQLNLTENETVKITKQADKHHPSCIMATSMTLIVVGLILLVLLDASLLYLVYSIIGLGIVCFVLYFIIKAETKQMIYVTNKRVAIIGKDSYFGVLLEHIDALECKGHRLVLEAGEGVVYLKPLDDPEALKNEIEAVINEQKVAHEPVKEEPLDKEALKEEIAAELMQQNEAWRAQFEAQHTQALEELKASYEEQINKVKKSLEKKIKEAPQEESKPKKKVTLTPKAEKTSKVSEEVEEQETMTPKAPVTLDLSKAKKGTGKVKDAKTIVEEKAAALKALENK